MYSRYRNHSTSILQLLKDSPLISAQLSTNSQAIYPLLLAGGSALSAVAIKAQSPTCSALSIANISNELFAVYKANTDMYGYMSLSESYIS